MRSSRVVPFLAAAVLLVPAGSVVVTATSAHAAACDALTDYPEVGSVDSDASPDIMAGLNGFVPSRIDLHLTSVGAQHVDNSDFTGAGAQTGFGASMTSIDLDHDGCSELIVGAPGGDGAVDVLEGSPTGVSSSEIRIITPTTAGGGFGTSVAAASRGNGPTDPTDLWIGAPDRTVEGMADAGAVDHYVVSAAGNPSYVDTVTADTPGIGGTVHANAHFGQVLSATEASVLIGAPGDTVAGLAGAGSATVANVDTGTDHVTSGKYWTQNSPGVAGGSEAGDHFGAAVYYAFDEAIVGVPGEDVGTIKDAGMVQFFEKDAPTAGITQGSPGIPGIVEAGDQFGASVALGTWLLCQESGDAAIGSPGEDVGKIVDGGSVTVMQIPGQTSPKCAAKVLTQGSGGLGGAVETGDHVGQTLSILRFRDDFDEDIRDRLVVGVPGEDLGTVKDAGVVLVHDAEFGTKSYGYSEGTFHDTDYGVVLNLPGGGPMFAVPEQ
jgi:hypothetical protein